MDNRTLLGWSGLAGSVVFSLTLFSTSYAGTLLMIALAGLVASSTAPCILSIVPVKFPLHKSYVYGYIGASMSSASLIMPSVVGMIADASLPIDRALLLSPLAACSLGLIAILWKVKDTASAR